MLGLFDRKRAEPQCLLYSIRHFYYLLNVCLADDVRFQIFIKRLMDKQTRQDEQHNLLLRFLFFIFLPLLDIVVRAILRNDSVTLKGS